MSSFSFIKKHKQPTNSNNNLNTLQYDIDSKAKNQDTFNGAPAQPAQSFNFNEPKLKTLNNNPPQPKKGFGFIKKKNLSNKVININNNLEKSNTSINSNDPKFSGMNNNQNNNNFANDLDSLINNTNDLLNLGRMDNNNNKIFYFFI